MKDKYYMEYRRLGLSIAYFRKYSGKTQQELADILDVNYETISRIENANAGVSLDLLFGISQALNVSLSEIFAHAKV